MWVLFIESHDSIVWQEQKELPTKQHFLATIVSVVSVATDFSIPSVSLQAFHPASV